MTADAPDGVRPARPSAFGALTARPRAWLGLAGAVVGGIYLAAWVCVVAHEYIGHGLVAEFVGGRFDAFEVNPNLSGAALYSRVPKHLAWIPLWGGIAVEALLGLTLLWFFRRVSRPLGLRSLVLFLLTAVGMGKATEYTLQGAFFGRGDAAALKWHLAPAVRIGAIAVLVVTLSLVLRWVVTHLLRWSEEQFRPANARQRATCFLFAVVVPLALLFALLPRNDIFPVWAQIAFTGTEIAVLGLYGAWRARRPPADVGQESTGLSAKVGLLCLAAAALVYVATDTWLSKSVSLDPRSTREARPVRRFEARFPRTRLVPGLLGQPLRDTDRSIDMDLEFRHGPDGTHGLWRREGDGYTALDAALNPLRHVAGRIDTRLLDWIVRRDAQPLALVSPPGKSSDDLLALNAAGNPVWSWRSPGDGFEAHTILYDERGPAGIALGVGGEPGLLAIDLTGRPLWQFPRHFVIYDVQSHPALPGFLLEIGGDVVLFDRAAGAADPRLLLGGEASRDRFYAGTYVRAGRLFPDEHGRPSLLLAGQGHNAPAVLARLTAEGTDVWRATLPSELGGLLMLEPEGGPRLFVSAGEAGDLLVVDEDGTLLAHGRVPEDPGSARTWFWEFSAGEIQPDQWGIAIRVPAGRFLYRLHPELARAR